MIDVMLMGAGNASVLSLKSARQMCGNGLLIGPIVFFGISCHRYPDLVDAAQKTIGRRFFALWFHTILSLLAKATLATMPDRKSDHGLFRPAALLQFAIEMRPPNRLILKD
jgi:hypothetical protein